MKSVVHYLNSQNFPRIRVGIGKPIDDSFMEYVIGAVDEEERKILVKGVEKAFEAITAILENNIDFAMNKFN